MRHASEFGIDFELALGVRRHLQKLYGFSRLPSLRPTTVLSSDLLLIALSNIALDSSSHMRELEQWLDFLIDFYFQESGDGPAPTDVGTTSVTPEFHLVSSKSKESFNDAPGTPEPKEKTENGEIVQELNKEMNEENCGSRSSASPCLDEENSHPEEDEVVRQQLMAALESYRKQKKLQVKLMDSPKKTTKVHY